MQYIQGPRTQTAFDKSAIEQINEIVNSYIAPDLPTVGIEDILHQSPSSVNLASQIQPNGMSRKCDPTTQQLHEHIQHKLFEALFDEFCNEYSTLYIIDEKSTINQSISLSLLTSGAFILKCVSLYSESALTFVVKIVNLLNQLHHSTLFTPITAQFAPIPVTKPEKNEISQFGEKNILRSMKRHLSTNQFPLNLSKQPETNVGIVHEGIHVHDYIFDGIDLYETRTTPHKMTHLGELLNNTLCSQTGLQMLFVNVPENIINNPNSMYFRLTEQLHQFLSRSNGHSVTFPYDYIFGKRHFPTTITIKTKWSMIFDHYQVNDPNSIAFSHPLSLRSIQRFHNVLDEYIQVQLQRYDRNDIDSCDDESSDQNTPQSSSLPIPAVLKEPKTVQSSKYDHTDAINEFTLKFITIDELIAANECKTSLPSRLEILDTTGSSIHWINTCSFPDDQLEQVCKGVCHDKEKVYPVLHLWYLPSHLQSICSHPQYANKYPTRLSDPKSMVLPPGELIPLTNLLFCFDIQFPTPSNFTHCLSNYARLWNYLSHIQQTSSFLLPENWILLLDYTTILLSYIFSIDPIDSILLIPHSGEINTHIPISSHELAQKQHLDRQHLIQLYLPSIQLITRSLYFISSYVNQYEPIQILSTHMLPFVLAKYLPYIPSSYWYIHEFTLLLLNNLANHKEYPSNHHSSCFFQTLTSIPWFNPETLLKDASNQSTTSPKSLSLSLITQDLHETQPISINMYKDSPRLPTSDFLRIFSSFWSQINRVQTLPIIAYLQLFIHHAWHQTILPQRSLSNIQPISQSQLNSQSTPFNVYKQLFYTILGAIPNSSSDSLHSSAIISFESYLSCPSSSHNSPQSSVSSKLPTPRTLSKSLLDSSNVISTPESTAFNERLQATDAQVYPTFTKYRDFIISHHATSPQFLSLFFIFPFYLFSSSYTINTYDASIDDLSDSSNSTSSQSMSSPTGSQSSNQSPIYQSANLSSHSTPHAQKASSVPIIRNFPPYGDTCQFSTQIDPPFLDNSHNQQYPFQKTQQQQNALQTYLYYYFDLLMDLDIWNIQTIFQLLTKANHLPSIPYHFLYTPDDLMTFRFNPRLYIHFVYLFSNFFAKSLQLPTQNFITTPTMYHFELYQSQLRSTLQLINHIQPDYTTPTPRNAFSQSTSDSQSNNLKNGQSYSALEQSSQSLQSVTMQQSGDILLRQGNFPCVDTMWDIIASIEQCYIDHYDDDDGACNATLSTTIAHPKTTNYIFFWLYRVKHASFLLFSTPHFSTRVSFYNTIATSLKINQPTQLSTLTPSHSSQSNAAMTNNTLSLQPRHCLYDLLYCRRIELSNSISSQERPIYRQLNDIIPVHSYTALFTCYANWFAPPQAHHNQPNAIPFVTHPLVQSMYTSQSQPDLHGSATFQKNGVNIAQHPTSSSIDFDVMNIVPPTHVDFTTLSLSIQKKVLVSLGDELYLPALNNALSMPLDQFPLYGHKIIIFPSFIRKLLHSVGKNRSNYTLPKIKMLSVDIIDHSCGNVKTMLFQFITQLSTSIPTPQQFQHLHQFDTIPSYIASENQSFQPLQLQQQPHLQQHSQSATSSFSSHHTHSPSFASIHPSSPTTSPSSPSSMQPNGYNPLPASDINPRNINNTALYSFSSTNNDFGNNSSQNQFILPLYRPQPTSTVSPSPTASPSPPISPNFPPHRQQPLPQSNFFLPPRSNASTTSIPTTTTTSASTTSLHPISIVTMSSTQQSPHIHYNSNINDEDQFATPSDYNELMRGFNTFQDQTK